MRRNLWQARSSSYLSAKSSLINCLNHMLSGSRLYLACQNMLIAISGSLTGWGDTTRSNGPLLRSANRSGSVAQFLVGNQLTQPAGPGSAQEFAQDVEAVDRVVHACLARSKAFDEGPKKKYTELRNASRKW